MSEEDAKKALNEQYGGEDATMPGTGMNTFKFTKYSNAYMLVYVRKSDWDQVCSISKCLLRLRALRVFKVTSLQNLLALLMLWNYAVWSWSDCTAISQPSAYPASASAGAYRHGPLF